MSESERSVNDSLEQVSEAPVDSFWEINQYKRTVSRIENGDKQFSEMSKFLQERAQIEELYCNKLKEWSLRWNKQLDKSSEYNTALNGWKSMLKEADSIGNYHLTIKDRLHVEMENIKNWKKQNYHRQMLGGLKESKELEKDFEKAQKPWAKLLKKVNDAKKNYYSACREERLAQAHENAAKSNEKSEKVKSLQDIVEKRGIDREMAKSKYEQALQDISQYNSVYKDSMIGVFQKSQEIEKTRQEFVKNIWISYHKAIDTSDSTKMKTIYKTLKQSIGSIDSDSDLKFWEDWHGPGMAMEWPAFIEYNPEAKKAQRAKPSRPQNTEVYRLTKEGEIAKDGCEASITTMGSAGDWSEDDDEGVPVRALYDYKGQEEDEISFSAGDTLWKLTEEDEQGWSRGRLTDGSVGLYPANYVQPL